MFDTDTSTTPHTEVRRQAASHVGDALEALTDDHVRRHAEDPWSDIWNGQHPAAATVGEMVDRIDQATKSLQVARSELIGAGTEPVTLDDTRDGWHWSCHVCPDDGWTSQHIDDVLSFRRGHMRVVHGVEVGL